MELKRLLNDLWQKKWTLLGATLLPSLLVGTVIFLSPRNYRSQLDYAITLDSVTFKKISDRFYSGENLMRLTEQLQEQGAVIVAKRLEKVETEDQLRKILDMSLTPAYVDFKNKQNMRLTLDRIWADNVAKLEELKAHFVTIELGNGPEREIRILAQLVRQNFERELPLYGIADQLRREIHKINEILAQIERNRAPTLQNLEQSKQTLQRLRALPGQKGQRPDGYEVNISFKNLDQEGRFLPLPLQIQAFESEVVRVTEILAADQIRFTYHAKLQDLARRCLDELREKLAMHYQVDQFRGFLEQLKDQSEAREEQDFLNALLRDLDNFDMDYHPLTHRLQIIPTAKGTVKITAFCFSLLVVAAFFTMALKGFLEKE